MKQYLNLAMPCKIVLTDTQGFLKEAAEAGEQSSRMAAHIVAQDEITLIAKYTIFGETLYDTNIPWTASGTIGIRQSELKFFSAQEI